MGRLLKWAGKRPLARVAGLSLMATGLGACATIADNGDELTRIEAVLGKHIAELSGPDYGGRMPGTPGGVATQDYIVAALESYGFKPGMRGQWRQDVTVPTKRYRELLVDVPEGADSIASANVIGVLPGTIADSGAVVLLAHWDHLGTCGPPAAPDRLCNGAVDNASGVAVMLEIARRIAEHGPLERDLYVVATTAEEAGLVGAEAFADDPPVPLPIIVAAFNLDSVAIAPRGAPVAVIGWGRTGLDAGIVEVVRAQGRRLSNTQQQARWIARQDGYALLKRDVPSVLVSSAFADERRLGQFVDKNYHRATDDWSAAIELGGAAQDMLLQIALLRHFGNTASYPVGDD